jgi:hypothetical protein
MLPRSRGKSAASSRPKSKSFLRLSLDNAYAQLGVSPLASTAEISARINTQLAQARRRILAKASHSSDDPDEKELLRLQKIDRQIGDAKRRKTYDEKFPQNILLTVQPSASEQAWTRHREAGLISEWIYEGLGEAGFLPTPRCLRLWAPAGLEQAMLDFLAQFQRTAGASEHSSMGDAKTQETEPGQLTIHDLETMLNEE